MITRKFKLPASRHPTHCCAQEFRLSRQAARKPNSIVTSRSLERPIIPVCACRR